MSERPELSVVIPAFNEQDNVEPMAERLVAALEGVVDGLEVLFVDDGSSDATWERVEGLAREEPPGRFDAAVSRAVSWNKAMVRSLSVLISEGGDLLRFGPSGAVADGIRTIPFGEGTDRGIQVWPRETWDQLHTSGGGSGE